MCVSNFVNSHQIFISYLISNFSSVTDQNELLNISDSIQLKKFYLENLKKDNVLDTIMKDLNEKVFLNIKKKDTVTLDEMQSIAVKFFSILKINEEGYYVGKICIDPTFIMNTEPFRKPFVEAFCFSTISKYLNDNEINLYDEFVKTVKEIYTINLGINNTEKLLRAQGALYILMKRNEKLKTALLNEYHNQSALLPFVLKN